MAEQYFWENDPELRGKSERLREANRKAKANGHDPQQGAPDSSASKEPPRPLARELPPADPFPVDALGDILAPAAQAIHDRVQAPIAMCGQSVLAAAALATQGHANVVLPIGRDGRPVPLSCYALTIAETGERKSTCDHAAMLPIKAHEAKLRQQNELREPDYRNDKLAWEKAREAAVKKGKGDRAAIKEALDALGPPPLPPLDPMLVSPEPTYEGLCKQFAIGQPSLGIFSSEGGQFIGGHGMSDDAKRRTAAGLSELWDGSPIRRVRASDGVTMLPGRRLSMHLMAQPDMACGLICDEVLRDQGLLSRLLVTAPEAASGTRFSHEERPETESALWKYGIRMQSILDYGFPLRSGTQNELEPRPLALSGPARKAWIAFADHIERELGKSGSLVPVKGLANKLPEHAARLAGVLTLVQDIEAAEVAEDMFLAGVELAQHYVREALRLFGAAQVGADIKLAQRLLAWIANDWTEPSVSLPDIYQFGPNAIRDKATAEKIAGILEDHGWLVRESKGGTVRGIHRRVVWRLAEAE